MNVERRMPSLGLIGDDTIRTETAILTSKAPGYFWETPATQGPYHHPLCRQFRGLWAHTLMLAPVIDRLADSYIARGMMPEYFVDYAHAAAILHDQRKNGLPDDVHDSSVSHHDILMKDVILESTLPDEIAQAVAAHNGPWYDGPEPMSPLDELVHTADMVASTENVTCTVPGPIPVELDHLKLREME